MKHYNYNYNYNNNYNNYSKPLSTSGPRPDSITESVNETPMQSQENQAPQQSPLSVSGPTKAIVSGCSNLNLRQEPGLESRVLHVLQEGTEVTILDTDNGWCNVEIPSQDLKGFVLMDYLIIPE